MDKNHNKKSIFQEKPSKAKQKGGKELVAIPVTLLAGERSEAKVGERSEAW